MNERMQSPLGRAVGLGSAKEGVEHWWAQRVSAIALIPLSLWFVGSVVSLAGADFATFTGWLSAPLVSILMILLIGATFYHASLGLQVVVEDYIHNEGVKIGTLILIRLAALGLAVAGIFAVLRIAFGG